jgi:hypothetical protein
VYVSHAVRTSGSRTVPVDVRIQQTVLAIVSAGLLRVAAVAGLVHDAREVVAAARLNRPAGFDGVLDKGRARTAVLDGLGDAHAEAVFGDPVAFCLTSLGPAPIPVDELVVVEPDVRVAV